MNTHPYSIKNFAKSHLEEYVRFCCETSAWKPGRRESIEAFVMKIFKRPQFSPRKDLLLAFYENKIIGFLDMTSELKIGRIILRGFVHSGHRRLGLATQMFETAWRRAEYLDAKVIHICLPQGDGPGTALMERWEFVPARNFLELEVDLSERVEAEPPAAVELGCFSPGEEALLAEIQNRVFSGTWGFCPNSPDEIKYYLYLTDCRLEDIRRARSKEEDKAVGYCWAHVLETSSRNQTLPRGRIHMCGVDPEYQGRGLGRVLLCQGLSNLVSKGVRSVELSVDRENQFALSLYQSLGFKKISTTTWYEKIL